MKFANDVVLISDRVDKAIEMLNKLPETSKLTTQNQKITNLVMNGTFSLGEDSIDPIIL